jgi:hypothetical protein
MPAPPETKIYSSIASADFTLFPGRCKSKPLLAMSRPAVFRPTQHVLQQSLKGLSESIQASLDSDSPAPFPGSAGQTALSLASGGREFESGHPRRTIRAVFPPLAISKLIQSCFQPACQWSLSSVGLARASMQHPKRSISSGASKYSLPQFHSSILFAVRLAPLEAPSTSTQSE